MWRLNFGDFTKKDFVYTLNHKYVRVNGGEGMSHISNEYPTECQPDVDWGPAQCGMAKSHFAGRVVMYISTLREAGNQGTGHARHLYSKQGMGGWGHQDRVELGDIVVGRMLSMERREYLYVMMNNLGDKLTHVNFS